MILPTIALFKTNVFISNLPAIIQLNRNKQISANKYSLTTEGRLSEEERMKTIERAILAVLAGLSIEIQPDL